MIIISHRGNINGVNPSKENRPSYIDCAIGLGYQVEIDIRLINNQIWLGHDVPQYKIDYNWIYKRKNELWIHCKNLQAADYFIPFKNNINYFCHTNDPVVLTSSGKLWVHDLSLSLGKNTIIPLLSLHDIESFTAGEVYAICTDYPRHPKLK
tara:strand:- start:2367 stop:2822 length:456 start_codon:yes stop_codon:yes gene_type:complete